MNTIAFLDKSINNFPLIEEDKNLLVEMINALKPAEGSGIFVRRKMYLLHLNQRKQEKKVEKEEKKVEKQVETKRKSPPPQKIQQKQPIRQKQENVQVRRPQYEEYNRTMMEAYHPPVPPTIIAPIEAYRNPDALRVMTHTPSMRSERPIQREDSRGWIPRAPSREEIYRDERPMIPGYPLIRQNTPSRDDRYERFPSRDDIYDRMPPTRDDRMPLTRDDRMPLTRDDRALTRDDLRYVPPSGMRMAPPTSHRDEIPRSNSSFDDQRRRGYSERDPYYDQKRQMSRPY